MSTLRLNSCIALYVLFFCLCGFVPMHTAMADVQYVSDLLIISVKENQDPDSSVVGYLRSAAAVEILDETEELMQVRAEDGIQGWVRKKFIVVDKPKAIIIRELEEKIALLEDDIKTLRQGSDAQDLHAVIDGYKQELVTLTASLENEKQMRSALQKDLKQVDQNYQQILDKNKQNEGIGKELASVRNENKALKEKIAALAPVTETPALSGNMKWFLIGGGVLLFGFIIGRSIRGKRTYRY